MKNFIKEYLNIIAFAITGFVFVLTSFYLVINYYHSDELKNYIYISENDSRLLKYRETMDKIKTNLNNYKRTNYKYEKIYQNLSTCYNVMTDKELYYNIETNRFYTPNDIYRLGGKYQSKITNICWALHLSSINNSDNPTDIVSVAPFVEKSVNSTNKKLTNALMEIQNNSSYFFTTQVTSSTVRDYLKSDYDMIVDSYQEFADVILNLSEMISKGGNNG